MNLFKTKNKEIMENLGSVKFIETEVVEKDGQQYFVWPISDETKAKIRELLEAPDLDFGFNNTLEMVPRFVSADGEEITFFNQIEAGVKNSPHSKQGFIHLIQQKTVLGSGMKFKVHSSSGVEQPMPLGWPGGFNWMY